MRKKTMVVGNRAWNLLRVALLWARKGGDFRNRMHLMLMDLPNCFKSLHRCRLLRRDPYAALRHRERQFSFGDTPVVHVKMHRPAASSLRFKLPHIPCINPPVDFDFDFDTSSCAHDDDEDYMMEETADDDDDQCGGGGDYNSDEIDMRAEQFIAKFYEQIKLQRQISYLRHCEMLASEAH